MSEENLQFHLDYFDGPLDLLLHLIKDSKIDVESVFLSDVTEQFLKYLQELNTVSMDIQAEFLSVASTLLEIKSKALLPSHDEQTEIDDDAEELLRRLEEYKLFKDFSSTLKGIEDTKKFYREPAPNAFVNTIVFKESDIDALMNAFTRLMMMSTDSVTRERMVEKVIPKDLLSVEEQTEKILTFLHINRKSTLFTMFGDKKHSKLELVVTLLALLEMIKNQQIAISQSGAFEDIDIELLEGENK